MKTFQKHIAFPLFQIQSPTIEKYRSPYNNQNFLNGNYNPLLVTIHMVIKKNFGHWQLNFLLPHIVFVESFPKKNTCQKNLVTNF
jgi:hypothetical protein